MPEPTRAATACPVESRLPASNAFAANIGSAIQVRGTRIVACLAAGKERVRIESQDDADMA